MSVTRVRSVQMYFYSDGVNHFKVWEAKGGGWYVDVVDAGGETVNTVGMAMSMNEAERMMNQEVGA